MDIGVKTLRDWHAHDNGWDDVAYHFVIRRDGTLEQGRPLERAGAHTTGHNARSIGICLVGGIQDGTGGDANADGIIDEYENRFRGKPEANYTPAQWATLRRAVKDLKVWFPSATVHGHNEFAARACPCFDVQKWLKTL
jgi:N-acetyl-anhydromuramyl-L-alanine amidase AmpD